MLYWISVVVTCLLIVNSLLNEKYNYMDRDLAALLTFVSMVFMWMFFGLGV